MASIILTSVLAAGGNSECVCGTGSFSIHAQKQAIKCHCQRAMRATPTHREGWEGGGRLCQLPFNFRSGNTHFCIAIRIAMPWDATSAERNETKWNGMEWNRTTMTGGTAPQPAACTIVCTCSTYSLFIFSYTLSISLTHSFFFLLSCSFVPLGGNCSNLRARPLSTQKKEGNK